MLHISLLIHQARTLGLLAAYRGLAQRIRPQCVGCGRWTVRREVCGLHYGKGIKLFVCSDCR